MIQTLRAVFDATGRLSLWRRPAGREEMSQPASRAPFQPRASSKHPRGEVPRRRHRPDTGAGVSTGLILSPRLVPRSRRERGRPRQAEGFAGVMPAPARPTAQELLSSLKLAVSRHSAP